MAFQAGHPVSGLDGADLDRQGVLELVGGGCEGQMRSEVAIEMATSTPSRLLGLTPGGLQPGGAADLVLFDLALDFATCKRLAVARADSCSDAAYAAATGPWTRPRLPVVLEGCSLLPSPVWPSSPQS